MEQNETECELRPDQIVALTHLLAGATIAATAEAAGVGRTTIHRWFRDDFAFQAEFNRRRRVLVEACEARLVALAEKALAVVEEALDSGDRKIALSVLRGAGVFDMRRPGPTEGDPELLRRRRRLALETARNDLQTREFMLSLSSTR
jgi:AcrR family transcriptional regulator